MGLSERAFAFLLLRCPNCRRGRLFDSWFRMKERCACCGLSFYRESGYYVGAIYINYGVTVVVVAVSVFLFQAVPERFELAFFLLLAVISSLALFPHSRSLWIAIDYWISPWKPVGPRPEQSLNAGEHQD
jgi:uncharacterized protein (DUF983 family)